MSTPTSPSDRDSIVELSSASTKVRIAPLRGGMLIGLETKGRPLLYLDAATFDDATQNVRGGAPVLFPSPGKLTGDAWSREGQSGSMKQHGFARNMPWTVVARSDASLTLGLTSNAETLQRYPWEFDVTLTYALVANGVRIDQRVENKSTRAMPFGFGFHPYFSVPDRDKKNARVPTRATRAFDNTQKREIDVPKSGIDLTIKEVDLHLIDHRESSAELTVDGQRTIHLRGSDEYRRWVIWTLAGKDFVCVEPWTCPGDALNTGAGLIEIASRETRSLWLEITSHD